MNQYIWRRGEVQLKEDTQTRLLSSGDDVNNLWKPQKGRNLVVNYSMTPLERATWFEYS